MAYVAFPVLNVSEESKPTSCFYKNISEQKMADLSSQRHWSCEDCDESRLQKCCCCNCPCHASVKQNQADVEKSNVDNDLPEEERHDMFEWMARQRLKVHAQRESVTHEYATREPLQPEVVHYNNQTYDMPAKTSDSRNYLNAIQIVQNMKAKWEALTEAKNPPVLPPYPTRRKAFVKPVDMFQGMFDKARKSLTHQSEDSDQIPNLRASEATNKNECHDNKPSMQVEDAGTQTSATSMESHTKSSYNTKIHPEDKTFQQIIPAVQTVKVDHNDESKARTPQPSFLNENDTPTAITPEWPGPEISEEIRIKQVAIQEPLIHLSETKEADTNEDHAEKPLVAASVVLMPVSLKSHVTEDNAPENKAHHEETFILDSKIPQFVNADTLITESDEPKNPIVGLELVHPDVPASSKLYQEENAKTNLSLKSEDHVVNKTEIMPEDVNEDEDELRNFKLKKHQHRHSLKLDRRASFKQHESVEGLLPITPHPPQSPELPDPIFETAAYTAPSLPNPIAETVTDYASSSPSLVSKTSKLQRPEEIPWYSGWFSTSSHKETEEDSRNKEFFQEDKAVLTPKTEDGSLTASSIALEIEGHATRRATVAEDELLLNQLSADFDETVMTEYDSQVVTIHKSKSQVNISTEELKAVAKSLSQERIRTVRDESKDVLYEREFHICHKCKKIVKPGDATFQFQNGKQSVWHRKCFVCTTCQKQLGLMDHLFFEEEPYCYDDYVMVAHVPKCQGCSEFIFDPTYTSAAGHFWHKDHFICHKCHKPLVDTKYVLAHERVYCFSCHQKDFVRVCKSCHRTILPHESYVQSGEYFWHSNDSCLHCETCNRSLVGRSFFFRKAGHLYCNRYCSLGRGPPV